MTAEVGLGLGIAPGRSFRARPWASLAALGIVYGDLGTSPLYAMQAVVQATGGRFTTETALGVLSLIVWTLIVTVSIKYCLVVMRADNHGEGGILALMSLVSSDGLKHGGRAAAVMGLLGAALLYGDGMITPAISVLSAIEGVTVVSTSLQPYVAPIAIAILVAFFLVQQFGTSRIGSAFGPVMMLWFVVIAVLGLSGIVRQPLVLTALDPRHAIAFLTHSGGVGPLVLGAVFLCITGGEALYADLGHFGAGPIRLSWYAVVLPALLLSYAGQTSLLIGKGVVTGNPFFQLAPAWSIFPLVILATLATIIASQAIVTASFSMTRQAMQLGWLPGFYIRQTSDKMYGRIYVPVVNWMMMVATIAITVGFGTSARLAGAYGMAVSTTMLLTTCLLFIAMRKVWRWSLPVALLVGGAFLIVDGVYFGANLLKFFEGGWLPLSAAVLIFLIMLVWRSGADAVRGRLQQRSESAENFLAELAARKTPRVPGTAIFLTRQQHRIPLLMVDHIRQMGALQSTVIAVSVVFEPVPRIVESERTCITPLAAGIWRARIRFGFVEIPDVNAALKKIKDLDPAIDLDHALYFAARDRVVVGQWDPFMSRLRLPVFAFLYYNAVKAVDRFSLPPERVVEVARKIEI